MESSYTLSSSFPLSILMFHMAFSRLGEHQSRQPGCPLRKEFTDDIDIFRIQPWGLQADLTVLAMH